MFVKGKDRLYFEYAVYLLNKNIAQLRWLCGLNTTDLAATLPNLSSLLQHLLALPHMTYTAIKPFILDLGGNYIIVRLVLFLLGRKCG